MTDKEMVYRKVMEERKRKNLVILDLANDLEKGQQCKHCKKDIHCEIHYIFGKPIITNVCCEKQLKRQIQKLPDELIKEFESIPKVSIDFDKKKMS